MTDETPDPLAGTPFEEAPTQQAPQAPPSMIIPCQGIEVTEGGELPGDLGFGTLLVLTNVYNVRAQLLCADVSLQQIIERLQAQLRGHKAMSGRPGIILPNGRTAPR